MTAKKSLFNCFINAVLICFTWEVAIAQQKVQNANTARRKTTGRAYVSRKRKTNKADATTVTLHVAVEHHDEKVRIEDREAKVKNLLTL